MKILAVDDEELALEGLLYAIRQAAPDAQVAGFADAEDALCFVRDKACDVAFLDIEMAGENGVALARRLIENNRAVNIVFTTGYSEYRDAAFDMHASGYLLKPITPEKIKKELEDLRHPVARKKRLKIQCFGNFEVYLDGLPLRFKYERTKELLAYLVDRKGALCSNGEILGVLFGDDKNHDVYFRTLRKDLMDTLSAKGCGGVVVQYRGNLGVIPDEIECDYYNWCSSPKIAAPTEYMSQYSWSEYTIGLLQRDF